MYNSAGRKKWGSFDDQRGAPAKISADEPIVSVNIPKIIQIWDGRQKVVVQIQKT